MHRGKIIGAVEIGTSKVVVLTGEVLERGRLEILSRGVCTTRGVTKGEIVNYKEVLNAAHAALQSAEQSAGIEVDSAYLAMTGSHLGAFYHEGVVNVTASDDVVCEADFERAQQEAKGKQISAERIFLHHIRNPVRLDDRVVENPVGMAGARLRVGYWHVHGNRKKIHDRIGVINAYRRLRVDDVIINPLASAMMVSTAEEKKSGVLVVDIGGGTTDYVLYRDGYVAATGVIPVGGEHITSDLSFGLRIHRKHAEKIKVDCGRCLLNKKDQDDLIWTVGDRAIGDRSIPKKAVYTIIQARVQELFHILHRQVGSLLQPKDVAAGVVLTGGTSRLPDICQVATQELGLETRLAEHPSWVNAEINEPEYSTCLGLFHYALTAPERDDDNSARRKKGGRWFGLLGLGR